MLPPVMRLFEDTITGGNGDIRLPALPRMLFVVHGTAAIDGKSVGDGEAWHGQGAATIQASKDGVTLWRYELASGGSTAVAPSGPGLRSSQKLSALLETVPKGELLMRG